MVAHEAKMTGDLERYNQKTSCASSYGIPIFGSENAVRGTVVLVHGLGGSMESWRQDQIVEPLAKSHQVIRLSLRGHGNTAAVGNNYDLNLWPMT